MALQSCRRVPRPEDPGIQPGDPGVRPSPCPCLGLPPSHRHPLIWPQDPSSITLTGSMVLCPWGLMPPQRGPCPVFGAWGWLLPICLFKSVTMCPQVRLTLWWPQEGRGVSPLAQETTTPQVTAKPSPHRYVLAPHGDMSPSLRMSGGQGWPLSAPPCPGAACRGSRGSPQVRLCLSGCFSPANPFLSYPRALGSAEHHGASTSLSPLPPELPQPAGMGVSR